MRQSKTRADASVASRVGFWKEGGPLWRSVAFGAPADHPPAHRCEKPVLLLYGFLATPRIMSVLAHRLAREGYCAFWVDLGGLFGGFNAARIEALGRLVGEQVETLSRRHGIRSLDVIGHSEGGLIGRYYVQRLGGAARVRRLITLATPHRGTLWAYPGCLVRGIVPSLPQMAPGSRLLRELRDEHFPVETRLTSVYSLSDVLCPPSACRIDTRFGAHLRNVEVARAAHLDFLFRKPLFALVREELRLDAPVEPGRTAAKAADAPAVCVSCGAEVAPGEMRAHLESDSREIRNLVSRMIRSRHPKWVAKDGSCPMCDEYYERL